MLWKVTIEVKNKTTGQVSKLRFVVAADDDFEAKFIVLGAMNCETHVLVSVNAENLQKRMIELL